MAEHNNNLASTVDDDVNRTVEDLTKAALEGKGTQIMNESISDYEVKNTNRQTDRHTTCFAVRSI